MKKVGVCKDRHGVVSDLFKSGDKYYRNPENIVRVNNSVEFRIPDSKFEPIWKQLANYRVNPFDPFYLPGSFTAVKEGKWRKLVEVEKRLVRKRFGTPLKCSFAFDQGKYRKKKRQENNPGYFCYTHRARSKGYPSIDKIPINTYKFIQSTG